MSTKYSMVGLLFTILIASSAKADNAYEDRTTTRDQVAAAYLRQMGSSDLSYDDVHLTYIGSIHRRESDGHWYFVPIYNCAPSASHGSALGQTGGGTLSPDMHSSGLLSPKSMLIEFDAYTAIAKPYLVQMQDAAYMAFGTRETKMTKDGTKTTIRNSFMIPIQDQAFALTLAKVIFSNAKSATRINFDFEGELLPGNNGVNLPWNNWQIRNLRPARKPNLRQIIVGVDVLDQTASKSSVHFLQPPLAILDKQGRVIEGSFPVGDLAVDTAKHPVQGWQAMIVNDAQARLSAKFVSVKNSRVSPELLTRYFDADNLDPSAPHSNQNTWINMSWNLKGERQKWNTLNRMSDGNVELIPRISSLIGGAGPDHSSSYKYRLKFQGANDLNLTLLIQNDLQGLVGRAIPFGIRPNTEIFQSGGNQSEEHVSVQFGIGKVFLDDSIHGGGGYTLERNVPTGSIIIHELQTSPQSGEILKLVADLEFSVDAWADVHPSGHIVTKINAKFSPREQKDDSKLGGSSCGNALRQ